MILKVHKIIYRCRVFLPFTSVGTRRGQGIISVVVVVLVVVVDVVATFSDILIFGRF